MPRGRHVLHCETTRNDSWSEGGPVAPSMQIMRAPAKKNNSGARGSPPKVPMAYQAASDPGFAANIARFAAAVDGRALPPEVVAAISVRIVDTMGCMLGARKAGAVHDARRMAFRYTGSPPAGVPAASVLGCADPLPVEATAFVNGVAARYLDFNDIYLSKEAIHPSDNLSVAFALTEALRRDGAALLLAAVRGYEVHCRLADTLSTRKGGWDNVVLGAIASSVIAGSLLGLDVARQAQAINLAAIANVALMQTRVGTLSMWKAAAAANAARAGLFAALLASEGITGPDHALDGTHGLFARVTGVPAYDAFTDATGPFRLLETHLKAYPSQYFTQTAIDAALALRDRLDLAAVERVEVATFEFGRVAAADGPDKWHPATRETADHSMPYCVAIALLDGVVGEAQFDDACVVRADVHALMQKITVVEDPGFTAAYPSRVPTRIVVTHADGRSVDATMEYPCGHSRNPMTRAQVDAKFADLAGTALTAETLPALWRLPDLTDQQTNALLCALLRMDMRHQEHEEER